MKGSVSGSFLNGTIGYALRDDTHGNLRDTMIITSSFASASRCIFHMTFNDEFRQFEETDSYGISKKHFSYLLGKTKKSAENNNVRIATGVITTGRIAESSGLSGQFSGSDSYVRIPHDPVFDRFNRCDNWTISFWIKKSANVNALKPIISKGGVRERIYWDGTSKQRKMHTHNRSMLHITASYAKKRTPFLIGVRTTTSRSGSYHFQASNGNERLHLSASSLATATAVSSSWDHVIVRNSSSMCEMFVNGVKSTRSGSLPSGTTANNSDIMIGSFTTGSQTGPKAGLNDDALAEIRMYDYALNNTAMTSIGHRDFQSGSLYQTNVAGNVFYRNGQLVVSSPMPKHITGSGAFENTFNLTYRGTHKIYENQVFVRVPRDEFNVSMNPSATFTPPTDSETTCDAFQRDTLPGPLRKLMFVSGTAFPYITTIGLYDDHARMLAAGKLAQPIQKLYQTRN
jgi:hypothetical protein